ncbi:MAG: hypothetical protein M1821_005616 [Bathelium mastoideum]|nr:MAG: hypothetical protein M1821_005616 [Bathelium mastoideum]
MATARFPSSTPFKHEADVDMNSFIDFSGGESYPSPKQDSYFPRPALEASELPDSEDFQNFSGPSHEYERYQQQTGLPPAALTHVHAFIDEESQTLSQSSTSASGSFDISTSSFNEDTSFDNIMGDTMDGFPFDEPNAQSQINHDAIQRSQQRRSLQEPSYRPGGNAHLTIPSQGQFANVRRAQSVSTPQTLHPQQTLQASPVTSRPASQQRFETPINVDDTIHRVLAKIRQDSAHSGNASEDAGSPSGSSTPHLSRAKKDEEEMDEDERLLASEEGKKLSSKERRQLRNKVSARAFRHRRKEYITTLEDEIKGKNNALTDAVAENHRLKKENEQMSLFIKELLGKPAFRGCLEDIAADQRLQSRKSSMPPPPRRTPSNQMMAPPSPQTSMQNFGMVTSPMAFQASPQSFPQPSQSSMQVQRTSGQEFDMSAISALNLQAGGEQWATSNNQNNGVGDQWNGDAMNFDFNNLQTFAVLELPEGPSLDHLRSETLSGKGTGSVTPVLDIVQSPKPDFPVIHGLMHQPTKDTDNSTRLPTITAPTSDDYDLFYNTPLMSPTTSLSGKYELVVVPSHESSKTPQERLESICQALEASMQRLDSLI